MRVWKLETSQGTVADLREVTERADELSDRLYAKRPDWVIGTISGLDARYLFRRALSMGPDRAVEIGTASGLSTAVLCQAMHFASEAGAVPRAFEVLSYDPMTQFYADESRRVGDATREMLPARLLRHIQLRNPALAVDVRELGSDAVPLLFIDGNHRHPWPALDMLATLDSLRPGAEVVLHDINLPIVHPAYPAWGAKLLFDELRVDKRANPDEEIPNIGSLWVGDKHDIREQLLELVKVHEWEARVPDRVTTQLLS